MHTRTLHSEMAFFFRFFHPPPYSYSYSRTVIDCERRKKKFLSFFVIDAYGGFFLGGGFGNPFFRGVGGWFGLVGLVGSRRGGESKIAEGLELLEYIGTTFSFFSFSTLRLAKNP